MRNWNGEPIPPTRDEMRTPEERMKRILNELRKAEADWSADVRSGAIPKHIAEGIRDDIKEVLEVMAI